jgi:hypothetical protein
MRKEKKKKICSMNGTLVIIIIIIITRSKSANKSRILFYSLHSKHVCECTCYLWHYEFCIAHTHDFFKKKKKKLRSMHAFHVYCRLQFNLMVFHLLSLSLTHSAYNFIFIFILFTYIHHFFLLMFCILGEKEERRDTECKKN